MRNENHTDNKLTEYFRLHQSAAANSGQLTYSNDQRRSDMSVLLR